MSIADLETYFQRELPKSLRLNECTLIIDLPKMVERHLSYLKAAKGKINKRTMLPYYERLITVKNGLDNSLTKEVLDKPK